MLRLVLAGVFFLILSQYRYGRGPDWALLSSTVIFITAALTDVLDGYLARKWKVESFFGRVMDPFCDKVLVIGAFIFLCGPRFVDPNRLDHETFPGNIVPGNMISGIYPWMVVLILARELLVTGIRDEMEQRGFAFGAFLSGKLKMILQSIAVPAVLLIVRLDPHKPGHEHWGTVLNVLVYTTVGVTVLSGWPYVVSALRVEKR